MSIAAWLLAIPQFIVASAALVSAIKNHLQAMDIKGSRPDLSTRMAKRSAGAIVIIVAYFPATIGWLLDQPSNFIPSITTVACFLWDFCVFFALYEWLKISGDEMTTEKNRPACCPCPYREKCGEDPYDTHC